MKRLLLLSAFFMFISQVLIGQTSVFHENFELPSSADSVSSQGTPVWTINTTYYSQGAQSMRNQTPSVLTDTTSMVTSSFSTLGMSQVILSFSQICKIEYNDHGIIEVSSDGGLNWVKLTSSQYLGSGTFATNTNTFNALTYGQDWFPSPADNAVLPANSWWRNESFDISSLVGNSANVKIRFRLYNELSSTPGPNGTYGWLIDNIKVIGSASELNPPSISTIIIPNDTVFGTSNIQIKAKITDASGVDTAYLVYSINGGTNITLGMTKTSADTFSVYIPFPGFGRTICYQIVAKDASPAQNLGYFPSSNCKSFNCKYNTASTATIGTGTSASSLYTFYSSYQDMRTQHLYTASEILAGGALSGGNISSLALNFSTTSAVVFNNFTISMKPTIATSLSTMDTSGLTIVYQANTTISSTGWVTFNFQTPFAWDGVSNILINFCFDNSTTGTGPSMYYTTTSGKFYYAYNSSTAGVSGCTLFSGTTSTYRANIKLNIAAPPAVAVDAGFGQLVSPSGAVQSNTNTNIDVKIKNFGIDTLFSATVNWKVDGVVKTPFSWSGQLLKDSLSSIISLGTMNVPVGNHTLEIWTSNPNSQIDMNWGNDTYILNFYACSSLFSGTYTVGGTNPDFATIPVALAAIGQCGINGPITLNLRPGIYTGKLTLGLIPGISATNSLTIKSENNDTTAILTDSATSISDNWIVKLNGAQYISLKSLTFAPKNAAFTNCVVATNSSIYNTIQGCLFNGISNGTGNDLALYRSEDPNSKCNNVIGNRFYKGSIGILMKGTSSSARLDSVYIYKNLIQDFQVEGIRVEYANAPIIDSNTVISTITNTAQRNGIHIYYCYDAYQVSKNNVFISGSNYPIGIYPDNCNSTATTWGMLFNNFITLTGGTTNSYGLRIYPATYLKVVFNSLYVNGTSTSDTRGINAAAGSSNIYLASNNVVSNNYPSFYEGSSVLYSDYNNYYSTTNRYAYFTTAYQNFTTQAALSAACQKDSFSISIDPQFVGYPNLHSTNFLLKGHGLAQSFVPNDIDNQARNASAPDPGADELVTFADDAGISNLVQSVMCAGTNDVIVKLVNFGNNTINSLTVNWTINGVAQTSFTLSTPMTSMTSSNINLGSYNFLSNGNYNLKFWTSSPNGNADGYNQNDTLTINNFHTSLSGTYIVGGTSADFATPVAAVTALNTYGICGPTILNINPGTYQGRLSIGAINGMSDINTLIIKSINNDTSAIITDSATAATNNWVLNLNGAKYVTIKSLTLEPKNTTYGSALIITNSAKYNTIEGNFFKGKANGTASSTINTNLSLLKIEEVNCKANNITGNRFYLGSNSIYVIGSSTTSRIDSILINKNLAQEFMQNGIYVKYANAPIVDSNVVISSVSNSTYQKTCINVDNSFDAIRVTRNTLYNTAISTSDLKGIMIGTCVSTATTKSLVANNFVTLISPATNFAYAMRIYPSNYVRIANNSVYVTGTNQTETRGINCVGGTFNEVINNNVVSNNYPSFYEGTAVTYSDYNNFYSTTNRYAYFNGTSTLNYTTQSALSTATLKDSNTISVDPIFFSNFDLHTLSGDLNGMAKPLIEVVVDIDNQVRSTTAPDIGADEYTPSPYDLAAKTIISPVNTCGMTNQETVTLKIKNVGSIVANGGFTASYQIKGSSTVITENVPDTILVGGIKDFSFATKADMTIGSLVKDSIFQFKAWISWTSDPIGINDTTNALITSGYKPTPPAINSLNANYATKPTITTTATDTLVWYASDTSLISLSVGKYYTTQLLYDTTTFWASAKSLQGMACESNRTPVTVNIINYPLIDAGITAITSPVTNIPSKVKHPLKVDFKNYGMTTLTSAKIYYSLNGILTDSLSWTGNLTHGSSINVEVDSLYLTGGVYNLKVWSSIPNSVADTFNFNDTATFQFNACMQGVYTIGKTPSVTYDFPSFVAARTALVAAGVCGNVIFKVDTGYYEERPSWPAIVGAGPNARIIFESMNGDSTSVTLHYTLSSAAAWMMKFTGGDYYTFRKMKLSVLGGNTWGRIFELDGGANYNNFEGCILEGNANATTSTNYALVFNSVGNNNYNVFDNCYFNGGSYAAYFYGSTTNILKGNVIKNSTIKNFGYYGIYCYYNDSAQIVNNIIESASTTYTFGYGVNMYYCTNATNVSKNKILLKHSSYAYGIYAYYCSGTTNNRVLISNNMISIPGSSASSYGQGVYSAYSNYIDIYFNSVNLPTTSTSNRAFYYIGGSSANIRNNNFVVNGGNAAYFGNTTGIDVLNYNNYYSISATPIYWNAITYATFASYKAATTNDANSLFLMPPFFSNSNLHLQSPTLSNKGQYIAKVPDDIDGETRGLLPTIGADEVPLKPIDGGVSTVIVPPTTTFEYDTIYPKVIVCNFGTDTLFTIPVSYTVNNGTPVTFNYVDTLAQYQCDTVNLPYFISPAGNSTFCAKTVIVGDSNAFNDQTCKNFFGTPSKDAVASRIIKLAEGCGLTTDTVRLVIKNIGGILINGGITASYRVNNSTNVITQAVTNTIALNDSITFVFNTPINLSVTTKDSIFNVKAWVTYTGDNVQYNDTTVTLAKSFHTPPAPTVTNVSIPYGTSTIITAVSPTNDSLTWYDEAIGGNKLIEGSSYTTGLMYNTDTFYVEARGGSPAANIVLGTGTSLSSAYGYPTAFENYWYQNWQQFLITKAELNAMGISGGSISSLAMEIATMPYSNYFASDYNIKIGTTTNSALSSFVTTGLTNVYGPTTVTGSVGWNTINFSTPFVWDGVSNIVIDLRQTGAYGSGNATTYYTTTTNNSVIYAYSSSNNSSFWTTSPTATTSTSRPNFKLFVGASGCFSSRAMSIVTVTGQSSCDVGIMNIYQPTSGVNLTSNETVKVKVKNFGTSAQSNVQVSFKVGNGTTITETIPSSIPANDTLIYTFSAKANLSIVGNTYQIKAWASLACDSTHLNDTILKTVTNLLPVYCQPSYSSGTGGGDYIGRVSLLGLNNITTGAASPYYTNYGNMGNITLSPNLTYTLTLSPGTYASNNNFAAWIDYNKDGDFFDTDEKLGQILISAAYPATGTITFTIPNTASTGLTALRVREVYSNSNIDPCAAASYGETEDYSITISPLISQDIGVVSILTPNNMVTANSSQNVTVKVKNVGSANIPPSSLHIDCLLDTSIVQSQNNIDTIKPNDTAIFTFSNITFLMGYNTLCIKTTLAGDTNIFNNDLCKTVFGETQVNIPYSDNFDLSNIWYSSDSIWQRGIPSKTNINSAPSAPNVWITKLSGNYPNSADAYIQSPKFSFAGLAPNDTALLKMMFTIYSQTGTSTTTDIGHIQYKLDTASYWVNLSTMSDPLATNGYTGQSNGIHGWAGTMPWSQFTMKLDPAVFNQVVPVQFRIRFLSNASVNNFDGMAVDNFKIELPIFPIDVALDTIFTPLSSMQFGVTDSVRVRIKNNGATTLTSIPMQYTLNGTNVIYDTLNGSFVTGAVSNYTFATPITNSFTGAAFNLCVESTIPNDGYVSNNSICKTVAITPPAKDAGVIKILSPISDTTIIGQYGHSTVKVRIRNFGADTLTSMDIQYVAGNQSPVIETWTGTLAPNDSVEYTFTAKYPSPTAFYNLCAKTLLTNDARVSNDQICKVKIGIISTEEVWKSMFTLDQNIPNPTRGNTNIGFEIPKSGTVQLSITNLLGQIILQNNYHLSAGKNSVELNVNNLNQGVYYYTIEMDGHRLTKKMIVIK